jgi:hypothetical protein
VAGRLVAPGGVDRGQVGERVDDHRGLATLAGERERLGGEGVGLAPPAEAPGVPAGRGERTMQARVGALVACQPARALGELEAFARPVDERRGDRSADEVDGAAREVGVLGEQAQHALEPGLALASAAVDEQRLPDREVRVQVGGASVLGSESAGAFAGGQGRSWLAAVQAGLHRLGEHRDRPRRVVHLGERRRLDQDLDRMRQVAADALDVAAQVEHPSPERRILTAGERLLEQRDSGLLPPAEPGGLGGLVEETAADGRLGREPRGALQRGGGARVAAPGPGPSHEGRPAPFRQAGGRGAGRAMSGV